MHFHKFVSKVLLDITLENKQIYKQNETHKNWRFPEIPYEERVSNIDCVLELPFVSWKTSLVVLMGIFNYKKISLVCDDC